MKIYFYKGLTRNPEIRNTPTWNLRPGDWGELGMPDLAWMSLMKCYEMLQNTRVTVLPFLSYQNQQGGGGN